MARFLNYVLQSDGSQLIYDVNSKQCIGRLMPGLSEAILDASPAIQSHSKPGGNSEVKLFDAESIAKFSDHWERVHGKTYPLADTVAAEQFRKENDTARDRLELDAMKARSIDFWNR